MAWLGYTPMYLFPMTLFDGHFATLLLDVIPFAVVCLYLPEDPMNQPLLSTCQTSRPLL